MAPHETTTFVAHGCPPDDGRLPAAVKSLDPRMTVIPLPRSIGRSTATMRAIRSSAPRLGAAQVDLTFAAGAPTAINGVPMQLVDLVGSLDMLVCAPRAGQLGLLDSPSTAVLHQAHQGLQAVTAVRDDRPALAAAYTKCIDTGTWFSPERAALDRTIAELEESVNGIVRLQLLNDSCEIVEIQRVESRRLSKIR